MVTKILLENNTKLLMNYIEKEAKLLTTNASDQLMHRNQNIDQEFNRSVIKTAHIYTASDQNRLLTTV